MTKKLTSTIKKLMCGALLAAACTSCNDWLDVSSRAEVKYDDLFSTKNGFKDQLTGIYTSLCSENLYGANLTYGMLDAMGQQYTWTGEAGRYYNIHRYEFDKSSGIISSVWSEMYNTIANINIFLKGIDEHRGVMSEREEHIYEGEAYGLRAFLHFDLLRLFGKSYTAGANEEAIPYVNKISKDVTPMSTTAEVIDLVLADLEKAEELLEEDPMNTGEATTEFLGTRTFHFNYYAVKALKARVYLYKNEKAKAKETAYEVMVSGCFPWVSPNSVTTSTPEGRDRIFSSECIFMLNNTKLQTLSEKYLKDGSESTSDLLVTSTATRNEIFETNLYGFDWRNNYLFENIASYYVGSNKLWQLSGTYNNRQPLMRISEMYLICSECTEEVLEAVGYLNVIRMNRGFDSTGFINGYYMPLSQVQGYIGKEYRKEFIGEGQWFYYCKRLDLDEVPNAPVLFSKSFYVLPIPDQEKEYGNR